MTRNKHHFRNKLSLTLFVFLALVAVAVFCCGIISAYSIRYNRLHLLDETTGNLQNFFLRLSNQMEITDYMSEPNTDIEEEFMSVCDALNARILVVNSYQTVVFDSYGRDAGIVLISGNIAHSIAGDNQTVLDEEELEAKLYFSLIPSGKQEAVGAALVVISIRDIWEDYENLKNNLLLVNLLAGVFTASLCLIFSIRIIQPFRRLHASLIRVRDENGELVPLEYAGKEAYRLSVLTNELLLRNKHLEESRQHFVSDVSHELKTPMTSMKVLAESILSMPDPPKDIMLEFLRDIDGEITRENAIISDILTLSSLEENVKQLNPERKNINEIMEIVLKRIRPLAEARSIEVILENYRPVTAFVDEPKMIIALSNICENAVKYNRDNGFIHVTVNADLHYFYISVEDSGIGMSAEETGHIFERFYRVDKARSREKGGTGLGLSITKEIIALHNGSVKVSSTENTGTTFMVRIPLNLSAEGKVAEK